MENNISEEELKAFIVRNGLLKSLADNFNNKIDDLRDRANILRSDRFIHGCAKSRKELKDIALCRNLFDFDGK